MHAAIPFFGLGVYRIPIAGYGEIPLDPWAILVCLGFVIGMEIARARGIRLGLDVRDVVDGAVVIVVTGFLIGHVVTVLFYFPERLAEEGIWAILRFWTGFSSIGGFLGALLGTWVFYQYIRPRDMWRFADVISFGFPFGWFFGRIGCGVVHDHVGATTTFPLAMDFDHGWLNFRWVPGDPFIYAEGVRHELGLYEAALMIPIMALFLYLGRRDWVPGFFTGLFFILYAPVRFFLDFLRNSDLNGADMRYASLTPAQWGCLVTIGLCIALLATRDWKGFRPWALDGKPNQAERAALGAEGLKQVDGESGAG